MHYHSVVVATQDTENNDTCMTEPKHHVKYRLCSGNWLHRVCTKYVPAFKLLYFRNYDTQLNETKPKMTTYRIFVSKLRCLFQGDKILPQTRHLAFSLTPP
jgi:hypothetical protein